MQIAVAADSSKGISLVVKLTDADGKPVRNTRVRVFDGNKYWSGQPQRYKMQMVRTNQQGLATFKDFFDKIPEKAGYWIQVIREKNQAWRSNDLTGRGMKLSTTAEADPLVQTQVSGNSFKITINLRQECPTDIAIVDATTGQRRHFAQLFFKDDRVEDWTIAALQDYVGDPGGDNPSRLGLDFVTTMVTEMRDAKFMATREGYYPQEFRLNEKLSVDKTLKQRVELQPAPLVELTVLGIDGAPVEGAKLRYLGPNKRGSVRPNQPTDRNGRTILLYPELGRLARYEIVHQDGTVDFSMSDLPVDPKLYWQSGPQPKLGVSDPNFMKDGKRWAVIRHTVQLPSADEKRT